MLHRLYMANLGDCRAVLCRASAAVDMTIDCKASRPDEIARIVEAGGFVSNGRVRGQLAVSRALGDSCYKASGGAYSLVLSEPELSEVRYTTVLR
jgi:serine/threonine protein phosphatase PrpC